MSKYDTRTPEAKEWHKLYDRADWQRLRTAHLKRQPYCVFCKEEGNRRFGKVVDHIKEHKGDLGLFFNPANLQTCCPTHHNATKQQIERGATYTTLAGPDGVPLDPNHPINTEGKRRIR